MVTAGDGFLDDVAYDLPDLALSIGSVTLYFSGHLRLQLSAPQRMRQDGLVPGRFASMYP